jgi:hypothetical protein
MDWTIVVARRAGGRSAGLVVTPCTGIADWGIGMIETQELGDVLE